MEMQGSRLLSLKQELVWQALNDPDVLKVCVPGCESIEATDENAYKLISQIKIGPVSAKFKSALSLTDIKAPHSYTLHFEGNGGAAGFGKGTARVTLNADGDQTELAYQVQATVGGKIAQVGQRLIDGVAKSMSESFFKRFEEEMLRRHPPLQAAQGDAAQFDAAPAASIPPAKARQSMPGWAWGVIVVVIIVLGAWAAQS
ncbi:MAG TPA: carbon monoxide dehydrogenase subunit G [Pusillimonas sp.]